MTDYIDELQAALRAAAVREYQITLPALRNEAPQTPRHRAGSFAISGVRRRRRTAARVATAAFLVAAAVFLVANLVSPGSNPAVSPAQAQTILMHVRAALVFPPHAIYHERSLDTVTARDGATHTEGVDEWLQTSPPYNGRITVSENGRIHWEQAFVNLRLNLYDPATNTIYLAPKVAANQVPDTPQSTSALAEVEYLLKQPNAKINPKAVLRGKRTIELTFDSGRFSYWISPRTYQPLQSEDRQDRLPSGHPGVGITRYSVRVITKSMGTAKFLSLQAQHPNARIDRNRTDYAAARQRLMG